ncbi:hypothetical protein DPEC_G00229000 [Dallia pectoralis]|uniref:Uncharacterized protein n=1 Tax=Dallia pectoralis TaxID=75939 RepID=A0ACC2G1D2_DALPE|nr:hypothetical protein DPEC_G00229000 [Dallia pectoralis]
MPSCPRNHPDLLQVPEDQTHMHTFLNPPLMVKPKARPVPASGLPPNDTEALVSPPSAITPPPPPLLSSAPSNRTAAMFLSAAQDDSQTDRGESGGTR